MNDKSVKTFELQPQDPLAESQWIGEFQAETKDDMIALSLEFGSDGHIVGGKRSTGYVNEISREVAEVEGFFLNRHVSLTWEFEGDADEDDKNTILQFGFTGTFNQERNEIIGFYYSLDRPTEQFDATFTL